MNTARDLAIAALDAAPDHGPAQGDLSLALAGAELLDLADAGALSLDGDDIVPGTTTSTGDPLLDEAAALVVRELPHESVEDWLWRRGRELAAAYTADLERAGLATRRGGRRLPVRSSRTTLVDSPERVRAHERLTSGDPVFTALAVSAGILEDPNEDPNAGADEDTRSAEDPQGTKDAKDAKDAKDTDDSADTDDSEDGGDTDHDGQITDDTVIAVLAGVGDAVMELEAVRQRRAIESAAFDNVWRGW
ncbi:GPP34 family phosphoprotein [Streptomyces sp. NPDC004610]|uniref:GOLPH3/VPS74 family protein n=1 Tax=unclassified Streptomyces TaxID=2593676 RepID=UPI0033BDC694